MFTVDRASVVIKAHSVRRSLPVVVFYIEWNNVMYVCVSSGLLTDCLWLSQQSPPHQAMISLSTYVTLAVVL